MFSLDWTDATRQGVMHGGTYTGIRQARAGLRSWHSEMRKIFEASGEAAGLMAGRYSITKGGDVVETISPDDIPA